LANRNPRFRLGSELVLAGVLGAHGWDEEHRDAFGRQRDARVAGLWQCGAF